MNAVRVMVSNRPEADLSGALDQAVGGVDLTLQRPGWWPVFTGAQLLLAVTAVVGFVWLAVAGGLWLWEGGLLGGGFTYDAMVHAIFLGFVFSMIFAHAAVIIPAVLGVPLPYRPAFYAPLALLHASVALRLFGDLGEDLLAWRWGGVLGEVAIVSFLALAAGSALRARRVGPRRARISSSEARLEPTHSGSSP